MIKCRRKLAEKRNKSFGFLGHPLMILIFFIISATMIIILNLNSLSFSSKNLQNISGGLTILDTRFFYNQADIFTFLDKLGKQGRDAYQLTHIFPDLIFPVSYSLFFASLSAWLAKHLEYSEKQIQRLFSFTLLAGILDLLENFTILVMVASYPLLHPVLALSALIFTVTKFVFFFTTIIVLFILSMSVISKK